ncbi:ferritin-like domain-containing protein [Pseudomarimonas arenosa]|uniref:Ferritin-like domain-containing protein n=1 Tax=Pseudomarimonas arenosa TaxID=2774145 RepID=A0AAW3ZMH3_9GAMM|nr:ferritin-like domain-containing protein [Pseudomarimonas arenosa]MBD8527266.1 ferritin-like domain-containing protein [Pseudomarimonas arenosa]
MDFLRPPRTPLRLADFPFSTGCPATREPGLLAILKTTAMLESRADAYAAYLHAVFKPRGAAWTTAIDQWNLEERRHGGLLRQLIEATDPAFDFDQAMQDYLQTVPYHPCDGRSVRGSIAGELVARCVVEALASTYYRVLQEGVEGTMARSALAALAQDEARHYGMFRAMLQVEQQGSARIGRSTVLYIALRRMLELNDQQILGAYALSERCPPGTTARQLARRYALDLYPSYRLRHLLYAARLLSPIMLGWNARSLQLGLALGLWLGVRVKVWLARVAGSVDRKMADKPTAAANVQRCAPAGPHSAGAS